MTNLLFAIVVSLVTNSSEQISYQQIVTGPPHATEDGQMTFHAVAYFRNDLSKPLSKVVTTTVSRVTNAVNGKMSVEVGREELSRTDQSFTFARKTTEEWIPGPTNITSGGKEIWITNDVRNSMSLHGWTPSVTNSPSK